MQHRLPQLAGTFVVGGNLLRISSVRTLIATIQVTNPARVKNAAVYSITALQRACDSGQYLFGCHGCMMHHCCHDACAIRPFEVTAAPIPRPGIADGMLCMLCSPTWVICSRLLEHNTLGFSTKFECNHMIHMMHHASVCIHVRICTTLSNVNQLQNDAEWLQLSLAAAAAIAC